MTRAAPSSFQLVKGAHFETARSSVEAGEHEGAAPASYEIKSPASPAASKARTFAPPGGTKVTGFFRLSKKSPDFFESLE